MSNSNFLSVGMMDSAPPMLVRGGRRGRGRGRGGRGRGRATAKSEPGEELAWSGARDARRSIVDHRLDDRTEVYRIDIDPEARALADSAECEPWEILVRPAEVRPVSTMDENRLVTGNWAPRNQVIELMREKTRMDVVFDTGNSDTYYEARDRIFVQDRKGGREFFNRAGDKLMEIHVAVNLFDNLEPAQGRAPKSVFLDICGGPGAFTQMLLTQLPRFTGTQAVNGYGITLRWEGMDKNDLWYKRLFDEPAFRPLYGADGTGNVYFPSNVASFVTEIERDERGEGRVDIAVSDGGFEIGKDQEGYHLENIQELLSTRCITAEHLIAARVLKTGGNFVCKLFDTFSDFSASLMYVLCLLFDRVWVVKPHRSRMVNSERYVVAKGMRPRQSPVYRACVEALTKAHEAATDAESIETLVRFSKMMGDMAFVTSMRAMNESLLDKQTRALNLVMNHVDEELARKGKKLNEAIAKKMREGAEAQPEYSAVAVRLMALMGHQEGQGLGADRAGRADPIQAVGTSGTNRAGLGFYSETEAGGDADGDGRGLVRPAAGHREGAGAGVGPQSTAAPATQQDYRIKNQDKLLQKKGIAFRLGTVETGDREMVVTYPDGRREVREIHRPALGAPPPGEEGDSDDDPERQRFKRSREVSPALDEAEGVPGTASKRSRTGAEAGGRGVQSAPVGGAGGQASQGAAGAVTVIHAGLGATYGPPGVLGESRGSNCEATSLGQEGAEVSDRYHVMEDKLLGQGTYSRVFLARDKDKGTLCAIKHVSLRQPGGVPITVVREIKVFESVVHENVVRCIEMVPDAGREGFYQVLEYMDHDLQGHVREVRPTIAEVKCLLHQVLLGLSVMHALGYEHRDLKPANVLLDRHGTVKLADFGLSRYIGPNWHEQKQTPNLISMWFRPPEMLLGTMTYGPPADMWSVGCIFAYIVIGDHIFKGESELDQLRVIFSKCGRPNMASCPFFETLPEWRMVAGMVGTEEPTYDRLRAQLGDLDDEGFQLLRGMLDYHPVRRVTAQQALQSPWFHATPAMCAPSELRLTRTGGGLDRSSNVVTDLLAKNVGRRFQTEKSAAHYSSRHTGRDAFGHLKLVRMAPGPTEGDGGGEGDEKAASSDGE